MGCQNYLPPNCENLAAYDGFYVDYEAVYKTKGYRNDADWDIFISSLCKEFQKKFHTLQKLLKWKSSGFGQSRYVVLENADVQIIVDEEDAYIAVYVIIPETCEQIGLSKRRFAAYVKYLENTLVQLYPNSVRQRDNARSKRFVG